MKPVDHLKKTISPTRFRPRTTALFRSICCAALLLIPTLAARAQSAPPLSATFQVTSTTNSGYTGNLTITNNGSLPVLGYAATLTSTNPIVAATNATLSVNLLGLYVLSPPLTGNLLNPNDTVTFGLTFTGTSVRTPSALTVNLAAVPITTLPPSSNVPTSVPLSATFQVTSTTATGYTANLTITDNGALPVIGYAATLNSPNPITAVNGGTLSVGVAGLYVVVPPLVANVLNAGSSVTFGLTFTGASQLPPSVLTVNLAAVPITVLAPVGGSGGGGTPTPTPTPTPTATPNPTPTATPSPTPITGPTPTPSPTPITNPTPTPSPTPITGPTPSPTPITGPTPSPTPITGPTPFPTPTPVPSPTPVPTPNPVPGAPGTPILTVAVDSSDPTVVDATVSASGNGIAVTYTLMVDDEVYATGAAPLPDADGVQALTINIPNLPYGAHTFQALLTNPVGVAASAEVVLALPGASTISIGSMDDPKQALQVTIGLNTPTSFTLTDLDGATGPFTVITNDVRVLSPTITNGNTLVVTGLTPGRASVEIVDTATGEKRYLGIRVENADGTLPGLPPYLSQGSGNTSVTSDVEFYEQFGVGPANHRADTRYAFFSGGPTSVNPNNWFGSTQPNGLNATTYMRDGLKLGMVSFFVFENLDGTGSGFANDTANAQNESYMQGYFTDLRTLLGLIQAEGPDAVVGIALEPQFLNELSHNRVDPTTFAVSTDAAYSTGVLVHGTDPDFPNTVTGYVQAVNYLIHKTLPAAHFGWDIDGTAIPAGGYTIAPVASGLVHLTDSLGLTNGRPAIAAETRALANFIVAAGATSNSAEFVFTSKPGMDAGAEGNIANPAIAADFWNETYWNNFLVFTSAMWHQSGVQVIVGAVPYGHIDHSQLADPAGGLFPDLLDTAQQYEDSATDFFFGDTFQPGAGNRLSYFGISDPRLAVTVAGDTVTWPSAMTDAAAHGIRMIMYGPGMAGSTNGAILPPTDGGWWITALQNYYINGAAPEAPTTNPVNMVPTIVPAVVGTAIKPKVVVNTGQKGKIMLSLSAPAPATTVIHYKLMGQAINHVEYTLKKDKIKLLPGQTDFVVKIKPKAGTTLGGQDGKKVKLLLLPGDGYVVGTPTPIKVKIRVE